MKLTKKALNEFIKWSTSRYNDYLNLGNKKWNVDLVFNSIVSGHYDDGRKVDKLKTIFTIECAQANGETYNGKSFRYWKTKGRPGDYKYEINCINRTVTGLPSMQQITFDLPF